MKAKIKATGEVVEVEQIAHGVFRDLSGKSYMWDDFDSQPEQTTSDNIIDWEQRRYELAKAAMQGFIANTDLFDRFEDTGDARLCICSDAVGYADEMIKQLKEGQR